MSTAFTWKGVNQDGKAVRGKVKAPTENDVRRELAEQSIVVTDIQMVRDLLQRRVRRKDILLMSRQLARMVSVLPILESIDTLAEQTTHPELKRVLEQTAAELRAGGTLSSAFAEHPKMFDPLYVSLLAVGEATGSVESSLDIAVLRLEREEQLSRQARSAAMVPIILLGATFVIMVALTSFVIPKFAATYADLAGGKVPSGTQLVLTAGNFLRIAAPVSLLLGFVAMIFYRKNKNNPKISDRVDRFLFAVPLGVGTVARKIALARWARSMASVLTVGMGVLEACEISGQAAGRRQIIDAMDDAQTGLRGGRTLSAVITEHPVFGPDIRQMIAAGEASGSLGELLARIADIYEMDVELAVEDLISAMQPVLILIVGVVIGLFLVALYSPLPELYNSIGSGSR